MNEAGLFQKGGVRAAMASIRGNERRRSAVRELVFVLVLDSLCTYQFQCGKSLNIATRAGRARRSSFKFTCRVTNSYVTARLPVIFKIWRSRPGFHRILGDQDPGRKRDSPFVEALE